MGNILDSGERTFYEFLMATVWLFPVSLYMTFLYPIFSLHGIYLLFLAPILLFGLYLRRVSYFDTWFDRYLWAFGVLNLLYLFLWQLIIFIIVVGSLVAYFSFMGGDYVTSTISAVVTLFIGMVLSNLCFGVKYFLMHYIYNEREHDYTDGLFRNKMTLSFLKNYKLAIYSVIVCFVTLLVYYWYFAISIEGVFFDYNFVLATFSFATFLFISVDVSNLPQRFVLDIRGKL